MGTISERHFQLSEIAKAAAAATHYGLAFNEPLLLEEIELLSKTFENELRERNGFGMICHSCLKTMTKLDMYHRCMNKECEAFGIDFGL